MKEGGGWERGDGRWPAGEGGNSGEQIKSGRGERKPWGEFGVLKFLKKYQQKSNFLEGFVVNFVYFGISLSPSLWPSHLNTFF